VWVWIFKIHFGFFVVWWLLDLFGYFRLVLEVRLRGGGVRGWGDEVVGLDLVSVLGLDFKIQFGFIVVWWYFRWVLVVLVRW
jgi:hypothetical protein